MTLAMVSQSHQNDAPPFKGITLTTPAPSFFSKGVPFFFFMETKDYAVNSSSNIHLGKDHMCDSGRSVPRPAFSGIGGVKGQNKK
jgi:hypothetical protein